MNKPDTITGGQALMARERYLRKLSLPSGVKMVECKPEDVNSPEAIERFRLFHNGLIKESNDRNDVIMREGIEDEL